MKKSEIGNEIARYFTSREMKRIVHSRINHGAEKYGQIIDENDKNTSSEWGVHVIQEMLDAMIYLQKLEIEVDEPELASILAGMRASLAGQIEYLKRKLAVTFKQIETGGKQ